MDTSDNDKGSLLDKYKIEINDKTDKDIINWHKMLDLKQDNESNVDWYSTETFQIFLDALDINQAPISDKSSSKVKHETSASKSSSTLSLNEKKLSANNNKDNKPDMATNSNTIERRNFSDETILSAEALKILSELPDLSHMSSSRSFIFPTSVNNKNRKRI